VGKTEGTNHSEDLDKGGRIISVVQLIFKKQYVRWWNGVLLLRNETNGGVLKHGNKSSVAMKYGAF
jgi:hypothetical protein